MDFGKMTQKPWIPVAAIIGVTYAIVGIVFALPPTHAQMWRLAAWAASAAAFAAHICYERFRLANSPSRAGLHVAFATALGAFGLAVSANIHALWIGSPAQHRLLLMLSLGLWPLITGAPAFCVALAASWLLAAVIDVVRRRWR